MVRIRMMKAAKTKKHYHFKIVVTDRHSARDSEFIEQIGYYNPAQDHIGFKLNKERYDYWVSKGAQPTDTVKSLIKKLNT